MRRIVLFLIWLTFLKCNPLICQVIPLNNYPLLSHEDKERNFAMFQDENVCDTIRVLYIIEAIFEESISEDKIVQHADKIYLIELRANVHNSKNKELLFVLDNKKNKPKTSKETIIWEKYSGYIESWFMDFDFNQIKGNEQYNGMNGVRYGGVFYLVPAK